MPFRSTFPNSAVEQFNETSEATEVYNCIAWAYGVSDKWFWPDDAEDSYWPNYVPHEESIDAFIALFEGIGYEICPDGDLEDGFEKIAIYTEKGEPQHAARQLESGKWTSKLGPDEDVEHTIFGMSNGFYGNVEVYMRRQRTAINNEIIEFDDDQVIF